MFRAAVVFVALVASTTSQTPASRSQCLEPNGKFPVADQCDAYIECTDGVPVNKLCPDGMVLNNSSLTEWECALIPPHLVCGTRTKLQPAQPTEDCPHQFGLYHLGDSAHCGQYLNCANGVATVTNCSIGLAFNPDTWRCDWPDEVDGCDPEAYLQFSCPQKGRKLRLNPETDGDEILYHPWEHDCRYYFACVNNRPRLQNCGYCKCYRDLIDYGVDVAEPDQPLNGELQQAKGFSVDEVLKIQVPRGQTKY